jgi:hypothetical protein
MTPRLHFCNLGGQSEADASIEIQPAPLAHRGANFCEGLMTIM